MGAKIKGFIKGVFGLFILNIMVTAAGYPDASAWCFIIGFPLLFVGWFLWIPGKRSAEPKQTAKDAAPLRIEASIETQPSGDGRRTSRTITVHDKPFQIPGAVNTPASKKIRFIGQDSSINVQGYDIGGLVYVGVPSEYTQREEPAVINPTLWINRAALADPLGYWPHYSELDASQRGRYLAWLAGGKSETEEVGYAFLYFYGFERYVLKDAAKDSPDVRKRNLTAIVDEIYRLERLLRNGSFTSYSVQLVETIFVLYMPERLAERKLKAPSNQSVALRYILARQATNAPGEVLDSDWALQWIIAFGGVPRTKIIKENYPLLMAIFRSEYQKLRSGGICVPDCKTRLRISIKPAGIGFRHLFNLSVPDMCDPSVLKRPLNVIRPAFDSSMETLKVLTKLMAKQDYLGVSAIWPADVSLDFCPELKSIRPVLAGLVDKNPSPKLGDLAADLQIDISGKPTAQQLRTIVTALRSVDVVLVPDPSLTPSNLTADRRIFIYRGRVPAAFSSEATAALLTIHLGAAIASADGNVHSGERSILQGVASSLSNDQEREYLAAFATWRMEYPSGAMGLKGLLDSVQSEYKPVIGQHLVDVAMADGQLPPVEIRQLEKLFDKLGLGGPVTEYLHARSAPVAVAEQPHGRAEVSLDMAALQEHAAATREIRSVLYDILNDDAEPDSPEPMEDSGDECAQDMSSNNSWHEGELDAKHDELAAWLLTADEWTIADVELKCQSLGLMPAGALDTINNAAFDNLGDGLLDIGDQVIVYRDLLPA